MFSLTDRFLFLGEKISIMKKYLVILLIFIPVVTATGYVIYNETVECNLITGEGCDRYFESPCDEGYIFSEKDCRCVLDSFGCKGLDKEACEQNPNCYSFSRTGTCSCPLCEIWLEHEVPRIF